MHATEFEGLLYNMFSEEPFKNQIFDMKDEKDVYTVSDYVSHHFGILMGETWTYLTCHAKKKTIKRWLIYYVIGRNITEKNLIPISHDKKTNLGKICVTMTDLMVTFDEKTELTDVICEECSKSSGKTSETKNISSNIRVQIWKNEYCKNKTKIDLLAQYSMHLRDKSAEVLYIIVSIKINIGYVMDKGNYVCYVLDYSTGAWWNCDDDTILQYP